MSGTHDQERVRDQLIVDQTRNTARYFSENRHVAWVALALSLVWGAYAYARMPKAKDPTVEVRLAVASCIWPGAPADKVEELITRKIEQKIAESANIEKIESISRSGTSIVYVTLKEDTVDRAKALHDIQARLDGLHDLPEGALPIEFLKDFGETATLMLTVASPHVSEVELDLRARAIEQAISAARTGAAPGPRATLIVSYPPEVDGRSITALAGEAKRYFASLPGTSDPRSLQSPGFLGIDLATTLEDETLRARLRDFADQRLRLSELHPDVWQPTVVRQPKTARDRLRQVAGPRYSYRELDLATETIQRYLQALPSVSKITRSGVLPEQVHLDYSQAKLASYGIEPAKLGQTLGARNITAPGGVLEVGGKNVAIDPSGAFTSESQVGDVAIATSGGAPVYLRDLMDVRRGYMSPARYLNFLSTPGPDGKLVTQRAITLAINMRSGGQIGTFAEEVDAQLARVRRLLPSDLVIARTSDQPLQVRENVSLFMSSLYEAIFIVVLVALIGFWEWRTALLLAFSIPTTLALTFGFMHLFGVNIQQISIASLIIALGLLIDDPVVASDAIKHSISAGWRPKVAAWLGPTKLAAAIMFATVTNIAAYLPFLTLSGDVGKFIWSLPVVLSLSLVASRLVSMTFVPLLGGWLLRAPKRPEPTAQERRSRGFGLAYCRAVGWAVDHRFLVFAASVVLAGAGALSATRVKQSFFPKDLSYLSYVDVWLPEDQPLSATRLKVNEVQTIIAEASADFAREHAPGDDHPLLTSITAFVGGGGPRFWFSVSPELQQLNYAQLVLQIRDKELTGPLVPFLQDRISKRVAGARVDVRQLESGKPVGIPVAVRISGEDTEQLRRLAEQAKAIFRAAPGADRVRDDWGADTFAVRLEVDPDRANLAGLTNLDVARSSATAMNGAVVGQLREGDRQIPLVVRMRAEERTQLADVGNLYVYGGGAPKIPLGQISHVTYSTQTEKIRRLNQFRTVTVSAFPAAGMLPSEVLAPMVSKLDVLRAQLPPGYTLEIGGEAEEQVKSQAEMAVVTLLLLLAIYLALVVQFKHAVKPLIVFMALPYGVVAALVSLAVTGAPLGFMAMLGIISLMGVIVSHVIVLFDFVEEKREHGEPMRQALLDAGLMRLRPVLVTVVATVLGLVPLAMHGGPLWEPLCYAQIGGLSFATAVTLVLVPVLYTIFVTDLKLVAWDAPSDVLKVAAPVA